jgi:O-antigen ligase
LRPSLRAVGTAGLLALPAALTAYLSFSGGGFFPGTPAVIAVLLLIVLTVHVTTANAPFAGLSVPLVAAAASLGVFALWTLLSQSWSDAPGRALIEFDRAFLYLLVLVTFGALARTSEGLRWAVRGLVLAALVVCSVGLVTRVAPDVWPIAPNVANGRLSYPLTYWNALGLLAVLGFILALHLTTAPRERWWAKVAAAAALPVFAAVLLLTFSRGGIAIGIVGVALYLLVGRPRAVSGLLAAGPAVAIAVVAAYDADLLATSRPTTDAAVSQGHRLALVVALCVAGAAAVRALLLRADAWLEGLELPPPLRHRAAVPVAVASVVAVVAAVAVALGAPGAISDQYDRFVRGDEIHTHGDLRRRLTDPGNNGRRAMWTIALNGFKDDRLRGQGAGTFVIAWHEHRGPNHQFEVVDAHSLFLEVLHELGLPGLLFLVVTLALILGAFVVRARGPDRALYAALAACGVTWVLHAGVDWDWEMPAVTLWLFALGGMALAKPAGPRAAGAHAGRGAGVARIVAGIVCLLLAITPVRIALSEAALQRARAAFARGDCPTAIDKALDSSSFVAARAEPWEIVGFCDVRAGYPRLAVRAVERAVDRDPHNWELQYALALVRGAAGMDPRAAARQALRLNPREPLARAADDAFNTRRPALWRTRALRSRLPR